MADLKAETRELLEGLQGWSGRPLTFMEVCGTHTMSAARFGLRSLLPANIRLISGPGCPVCVTPVDYIDHALALAKVPGLTLCTFGDLVRVPGSAAKGQDKAPPSLQGAKASGADVRVVYSPTDALNLARESPKSEVVFLSVGFETTTPTIAATVLRARSEGLENFSILVANKTIPEPMRTLATAPELGLDGYLCPGHVSIVLGPEVFEPIARELKVPCAIAGFELVEILRGIQALVRQVEAGESMVDNCYPYAVKAGGNPRARAMVDEVFEPADSRWRGLGMLPNSGLKVREELARFDAALRFEVEVLPAVEPKGCRCGEVLRGLIDPLECGLFGTRCTPDAPRGACMVSSEGSCAARYHYSEGDWR